MKTKCLGPDYAKLKQPGPKRGATLHELRLPLVCHVCNIPTHTRSHLLSFLLSLSRSLSLYDLKTRSDTAQATGWRRLIGSPKLQIIFHKRATKYRALLRKMTYKDKGSYGSLPPCTIATGMSSLHCSISHSHTHTHTRYLSLSLCLALSLSL